ncbi:hypothetical protein GWI33_010905 [Rhynchophorus ferrugineus]|uniref:Uncharacterized protein n=1 Tax=Rhynchophorus ferrugineus TaxID=354439 RepID=A0A834MF64_RHYFE|nr:hypothetical protein GWI33_010905 [Rhynchophorus ferrugineus]
MKEYPLGGCPKPAEGAPLFSEIFQRRNLSKSPSCSPRTRRDNAVPRPPLYKYPATISRSLFKRLELIRNGNKVLTACQTRYSSNENSISPARVHINIYRIY